MPTAPEVIKPSNKVPSVAKDAPLKIEEVEDVDSSSLKEEKHHKKIFIVGTIVLLVVVLATGLIGYLEYSDISSQTSALRHQTSDISRQPEPTRAPIVNLDKDKITIEVLNASGVSGAASKIGDSVKGLGYSLGKIGNASGEHKGIEVYLSDDLLNKKDVVMTDLKSKFTEAVYIGELKDGSSSARLIVGK